LIPQEFDAEKTDEEFGEYCDCCRLEITVLLSRDSGVGFVSEKGEVKVYEDRENGGSRAGGPLLYQHPTVDVGVVV
jgi:hypothetical protein